MPEGVRVDARLLPAILLLQQYVDEARWGSVTIRFQEGVPGVGDLNETVRFEPGRVASGVALTLVLRDGP